MGCGHSWETSGAGSPCRVWEGKEKGGRGNSPQPHSVYVPLLLKKYPHGTLSFCVLMQRTCPPTVLFKRCHAVARAEPLPAGEHSPVPCAKGFGRGPCGPGRPWRPTCAQSEALPPVGFCGKGPWCFPELEVFAACSRGSPRMCADNVQQPAAPRATGGEPDSQRLQASVVQTFPSGPAALHQRVAEPGRAVHSRPVGCLQPGTARLPPEGAGGTLQQQASEAPAGCPTPSELRCCWVIRLVDAVQMLCALLMIYALLTV